MTDFDLAVIGTGSGNSLLGEEHLDTRVALCEQGTFGGTCLNVGCIPTKMFVYAAEVARTVRDAGRYGIDAHLDGVRWPDIVSRVFGRIDPLGGAGERHRRAAANVTVFGSHTAFAPGCSAGEYRLLTADGEEFTAEQVVIAAGSRPVLPPALADCPGVHTSDTVMRIAELPEQLVIVGGGYVACEFAHIFSSLGAHVTMVVRGSTLLGDLEEEVAERFTESAAKKWQLRTHRSVTAAHQDGHGVRLTLDDGSTLHADVVLAATGRTPNGDRIGAAHAGVACDGGRVVVDDYQRTSARGVFALGDVSSHYPLKHVANHEARVVRHNLRHDWDDTDALRASDHRYVPSAVFTDPQIASVGLTELQAAAAGYRVRSKVKEFGEVAYGWAMEDTTGFAKIVVADETGELLGAHIMGHEASSLIQPLVQAMTFGIGAQDMARGQYWIHPALSEVVENALLDLCGEPAWPPTRPR